MTKIIGLTGGIGSGKTTIAKYFESKGIPVYIADIEAKKIMDSNLVIGKVVDAFGIDLLENDKINRAKLSAVVFNNPEKLARLNAIIHPEVKIHFMDWVEKHKNFPIVIKETAILFESGSYKDCDKIILVTAPKEVRIQRVMERDNITEDAVKARMSNQWEDDKKMQLSDFVIQNIHLQEATNTADKIISALKNQ